MIQERIFFLDPRLPVSLFASTELGFAAESAYLYFVKKNWFRPTLLSNAEIDAMRNSQKGIE